MKIGDIVYETHVRRKAKIIDIEHMSEVGGYPDRYVLEECRSKNMIETIEKFLRYWALCKHCKNTMEDV